MATSRPCHPERSEGPLYLYSATGTARHSYDAEAFASKLLNDFFSNVAHVVTPSRARIKVCHSNSSQQYKDVIPNRAESRVRNLLLPCSGKAAVGLE